MQMGDDFMDARNARLGDVLEDIGTKTLKYLYDFGDGWEHTIKIERLVDPKPGMQVGSPLRLVRHRPAGLLPSMPPTLGAFCANG